MSKACSVAFSWLLIFQVGGLLAVTTNTSVAHLTFHKITLQIKEVISYST